MIAMAETSAHKEWSISNYQNKGVRNMEMIYSDWRQTDKDTTPQPSHNYLQSYLAAEKTETYGNSNNLGAFGGQQQHQSQPPDYLQSARSGMKRVPAGKTFIGSNNYNISEPQPSQQGHNQSNLDNNYLQHSKNIASTHRSIFLSSQPITITASSADNQQAMHVPQKMLELPPERDQNLMNMQDYLRTSYNTVLSSPEEKNKQMPNSFPVFSPRDQYALPAAAAASQQATRNPAQTELNIINNNKQKGEWVNDISNNQTNPQRNKSNNNSILMTTIPQQQTTMPQLRVINVPFEGSRNRGYLQAPHSTRSKRIFAEDEEEDHDMLNRSASYARNIEILNSSLNQQGDFLNQTRRNYKNNHPNRSNISNDNDMSRLLNGSDNDILSNQGGYSSGNPRNNQQFQFNNSILQQSQQNLHRTRFNNNNNFSQSRLSNNFFSSKKNLQTSAVNNPRNIDKSQKFHNKPNKSFMARESAALEACAQQLTLQQVYCHNCMEFIHFAEWEKADEHSKYCVPVEQQLQQFQTVQQQTLGQITVLNGKLQKMEYLLKKMETVLNDESFLCCRYEVKQEYLPGIHGCLDVMTDTNCSASSEVFHSALGQFKQHASALDALQAVYSTPESTQFLQILNTIIEIALNKIELARKLQ